MGWLVLKSKGAGSSVEWGGVFDKEEDAKAAAKKSGLEAAIVPGAEIVNPRKSEACDENGLAKKN